MDQRDVAEDADDDVVRGEIGERPWPCDQVQELLSVPEEQVGPPSADTDSVSVV